MKLAIITSGFLPIPATKGGAVENLIENFMKENEKYNDFEITIFSEYDETAKEAIKSYKNSNVIFIKSNFIADKIDKLIFFVAKNILKKKNSHSYRFILKRLFFLNKVSKYLKKLNFDKILLENHPTQYLALKWRKNYIKYDGKYYYHCHNELPSTYGCKEIMEKTRSFICVSKFRKDTISEYLKFKNTRFTVVKNGIDTLSIKKSISNKEKEEIKKSLGIRNDDKILIYTGRIVEGKGVKELISALKNVKFDKYKLLLVGSSINALNVKSAYEEETIKLINEIKDKVICTGFISYKELYKYYGIADIAILPSIIDDSAPLTIIESLVCGLPIITTNSGGIPEYVNNKCAIILNRDKDIVKNLTKSIEMLCVDEKKCEEMSKESYKISENLTMEEYYKNLTKELLKPDDIHGGNKNGKNISYSSNI